VGSARLGTFVWPGMILAGCVLAVAVLAAWPEPTTQTVRLPYGESQPKSPVVAPLKQARVVARASVEQPVPQSAPAVTAQPETEPARVLAAVEPVPDTAGPAPMPSQIELDENYVQESPEELGAEPLPGADLTQLLPPAAG
jgi:hypothetical protein